MIWVTPRKYLYIGHPYVGIIQIRLRVEGNILPLSLFHKLPCFVCRVYFSTSPCSSQ